MFDPNITSGNQESVWLSKPLAFTPLAENIACEICIIGAGIAGLSIAYQLASTGRQVVVIEDGFIASGETGRTTAHLFSALDDRFYNVAAHHGEEKTKLAAQSHEDAINYIEAIIKQEKIDCDFKRVDGYLFLAPEDNESLLHKEYEAAKRAGVQDVVFIDAPNLTGFAKKPCLKFPKQAQFHPLKYLTALTNILRQKGVQIYTQTQAVEVKAGKPVKIITNKNYTISAVNLVIATNTPIYDEALLFSKQESNRSYAIAAAIPKDTLAYALYWDTAKPYHYVRLQPYDEADDLIIVGGEDHRTGVKPADPQAPLQHLETWARHHFPQMKAVKYRWSGQVQEPVDYLAFIGRLPKSDNIYTVTGDSGHGMTHALIAAILITDLITGKDNPWQRVYAPNRPIKKFSAYICHNLKSAGHYLDHLTPGEINSVDKLKPGEGAVIRCGLKKVAVYRDEHNQLHERSALCTHMQAVVKWNNVEKTWDCPAHGSRFAVCGKVLHGPAKKPLK